MINFIKLKEKLKEILHFALPMSISFIAIGLMGIVDTMVVGNYNLNQLAYMGLANSMFVLLFTIPTGLLDGVLIKSAQKFGAKKYASCGKIYNEGRKYLIPLSIIFTSIGFFAHILLKLFGQSDYMVENTAPLLILLSTSVPFSLIYINANFFLQSIKRPYISMYGIIIANIINLIFDSILVNGYLGLPALGAMGACLTTVIVRISLASYLLVYIYNMKRNPKINKRFGLDRSYKTWWKDSKSTRQIGYGRSLIVIAGNGSMFAVNAIAAKINTETLAIFVIIINVTTAVFMIMFSISQATAITAARTYGQKDYKGLNYVLFASYILYFITCSIFIVLIYLFPNEIFYLFTSDDDLILIIKSLLSIFLFDLVVDSMPLNLTGLLSAQGDIKIPAINQVVSLLIIRVVASYILAIHYQLGIKGLLIGLAFGGIFSFILNGIRYIQINRKNLQ